MAINIEMSARLDAEGPEVTVNELTAWLDHIPPGASLSPLTKNVGSQRDPEDAFVGMLARWSETR